MTKSSIALHTGDSTVPTLTNITKQVSRTFSSGQLWCHWSSQDFSKFT